MLRCMKILTSIVALGALATGATGAAVVYVSTAPPPSTSTSSSASADSNGGTTLVNTAATEPGVRLKVRYRKCANGAHLEKGRCVRRVVRTVVVPAPLAVVPAVTVAAGSGTAPKPVEHRAVESGHHAKHEDGASEHENTADENEPGDDQGQEQGDDHGDDHGDDQPGHDD